MQPLLSFLSLGLLLSVGLFGAPAHAQNGNGLNLPPAGQTIINFSATERRMVPQDLLIASLRIEVDDDNPMVIQRKINEAMTKALELAKKESAFKVSTGGYTVHRYNRPIPRRTGTDEQKYDETWRGSQTIEIQSKDSAKLLDVTGAIQGMGFAMNNLSYTLAPETVERVRDELMVEALKRLQSKAGIVAKTLGKANYELVDVNVDTGGPIVAAYRGVMMRAEAAMAQSDAMPAPVAEAGETDVSLTVSARALIKP